jgi:DNA-binding NtrC family response regulator
MAADDFTRTATRTGEPLHDLEDPVAVPRLVIAMDCRRPLALPARMSLAASDDVVLGRGAARRWARDGRRLEIQLADDEMSRRHVRLRRREDGWELEELGSKNGSLLNGQPITRAELADGDLIEVGSTLLVFRDAPSRAVIEGDRELEDDQPLAFRTMSLEVEQRCAALARIAPSNVAVLIRGETGSGKDIVARAVHELSGRRGPFVPVNCGALPRSLLESELFGHRRGAFSGATDDREGLVRRADRGTLFLDEIAELPEESQVALLRVLQEGEVRPVGAVDPIKVDVRVVAATHQDLAARIADGRFRQDLYGRLAGFELGVLPLRERREDLGVLIAALLDRLGESAARTSFHRAAARALFGHRFPLNVRELEQALRAAVVLTSGGEIRLEHLPEAMRAHGAPRTGEPLRPEDEALRDRLVEILRDQRGNVSAAARAMDKAPVQIRRWCRRFAIDPASFRP